MPQTSLLASKCMYKYRADTGVLYNRSTHIGYTEQINVWTI